MKVGVLTLNRFNGKEQFSISEATIFHSKVGADIELTFEIDTDEPIKTLSDTESLKAQPNAEFTVRVSETSWRDFVGKQLNIPKGYDPKTEEDLTRFYYCEHETTDDNIIEIIEQKNSLYLVLIKATCKDVNYYDDSKPRTLIEIDAWFKIQEI